MSELIDEISIFREKIGMASSGEMEQKLVEKLEGVLQTVPVQNIKRRCQLGLLPMAVEKWETAGHSRFDHTVGVVARCLVACDIINKQTDEYSSLLRVTGLNTSIRIDENDALELCVAAALHDCGHLPASHATERALLSVKGESIGVRHEERIVPLLLLQENSYFGELRRMMENDWHLDYYSLIRICLLFGGNAAKQEALKYRKFEWPKRALFQMLNSALDMDRLDYILRDASKTEYLPVLRMEDSIQRVPKGLFLVNTSMVGKAKPRALDVELCLLDSYLTEAFNFLVSRVLLYQNVYFYEKVRGLEGILTHILGELVRCDVYMPLLDMITWTEEELIGFIKEKVADITDEEIRKSLSPMADCLKQHEQYYERKKPISAETIENPRLRQEFVEGLHSRDYVQNLKNAILETARRKPGGSNLRPWDILMDAFQLKTGGGDFLVYDTSKHRVQTLDDYMNGSNMHRLCSENRLDVYYPRGISFNHARALDEAINWFINL